MPYTGTTHPGGQWMKVVVVDAEQRAGESLSTVPSTRERRKPAQLHQQASSAPHASQPYHRVAHRFSGSACELSTERLCALRAALGHCVCVPPGGDRPRRQPASENPQVRPQSSNPGLTTPIGPILTRACVPVCVRSATEHGARPPNHGAPTVNFPTVAAANITAIRDLSTARCGRPSEVRAECQKSNRRMRARLATAASAAYRRRRCLRAAPALTPPNGRPIPLGPRRVRSRARRRYAAGALSMGPPSGAPGRPQRPLQCLPAGAGACKRLGRVAAHAVAWVACAEHAGPWRTAVACSAGRSAAPSRRCPFALTVWGAHSGR